MLIIRYYFRLLLAFLARFKGLFLIGAILGIIMFAVVSIITPLFLGKSTEVIGITGRFNTENLPTIVLDQISSGLTSLDETGTAVPELAASWETPDKGKTWIFELKENVFWQDGEPVTSSTLVYEFADVEIETPDSMTIIFKLKDVYSAFPSIVSRSTFRRGLLGTGEWEVERITLSGSIVHEINLINKNKDKKVYKFYPTEERTKLAFKLGEVDKIIEIISTSPINNWETAIIHDRVEKKRIVTIFFNNNDKLLSDKSVRQALVYAIDKEDFVGDRAYSPIPPTSWAYNPQVKEYSFDKDRATELLEDIPSELLDQEVALVTSPLLLETGEKIASYWNDVGIKTTVLVSSIIPSEFQAYLTIYDTPQDPDQYSVWHSTQTETNISGYFNPRIDKLLEDGRAELNFEERRKIYLDFQRFLVEDSPAAFLYHPPVYTIERK